VALLAMVFTVRQGENGPLLLYKLNEFDSAWTVVNPAPASSDGPVTLDFSSGGMTSNTRTGEWMTLQAISDDIAWRRDTAEKLRQLQIGPRF
jgi:hypothetical protein